MNAPARSTTLEALKNPPPAEVSLPAVNVGFTSLQSFELTQRVAKLFASSTLVPVVYRAFILNKKGNQEQWEENPAALANCSIALNMAARLGADPLMVMQNLHIIEGRPGWSAVWIIASINQCGRFEPLRFDMSQWSEPRSIDIEYDEWEGPYGQRKKVTKKKTLNVRDRICIAWTVPKGTVFHERYQQMMASGMTALEAAKKCGMSVYESTPVSVDLAIKEGWYQRKGSKWQTMTEQMLVYRSAAFFGRVYAPELLLGLPTADELEDMRALQAVQTGPGTFAVDLGELRPPALGAVEGGGDGDPGAGEGGDHGGGDPGTDERTGDPAQLERERTGDPAGEGPTIKDAENFVDAGDYDQARDLAMSLGGDAPQQIAERIKQRDAGAQKPAQEQRTTSRRSGGGRVSAE